MTGIVAHTYPEWWLKLTGQAAHWSTDYSKRMSLQELSDATGIPSSTLGNYEKDENVDMSLGNLLTLADFYQVSTDYLLCRTELREHTNKSVSELHLNDDAVQILDLCQDFGHKKLNFSLLT